MEQPAASHSFFSALTSSATAVTRLSESRPAIGSSTIAVTLPSSQTRPVPAARAPVQKPPFLSALTACAPMLGNDSAPAALIPCPCTISGMALLEASS